MKASDIPGRFPIAFAANANPANIRPIPQTTADPNAASLNLGFPPNTFAAVGAGGTPPDGRDENGILNEITLWNIWQSAGGPVGWDATFAAAISGYPQGAILAAAGIVGGYWLCLADDNPTNPDAAGANWSFFQLPAFFSPIGSSSNLTGSSAGGLKTAAWTADELVVGAALGGTVAKVASLSLPSFNGAGTGLNGMDTGSMPTASDLAIYAVRNPTTGATGTLGTTASFGPAYTGTHAVAGYTQSALIWAGVTSGGNFPRFWQAGRQVFRPETQVLTSGTATTLTALSVSSCVPAAAKFCAGWYRAIAGQGVNIAGDVNGVGQQQASMGGGQAFPTGSFGPIPMPTPQQIAYAISSSTLNIWVSSYGF